MFTYVFWKRGCYKALSFFVHKNKFYNLIFSFQIVQLSIFFKEIFWKIEICILDSTLKNNHKDSIDGVKWEALYWPTLSYGIDMVHNGRRHHESLLVHVFIWKAEGRHHEWKSILCFWW